MSRLIPLSFLFLVFADAAFAEDVHMKCAFDFAPNDTICGGKNCESQIGIEQTGDKLLAGFTFDEMGGVQPGLGAVNLLADPSKIFYSYAFKVLTAGAQYTPNLEGTSDTFWNHQTAPNYRREQVQVWLTVNSKTPAQSQIRVRRTPIFSGGLSFFNSDSHLEKAVDKTMSALCSDAK